MTDLGPVVLSWDRTVIEVEALERAVYELAAELSGQIDLVDGRYVVTLRPTGPQGDVERLADRFREEVVDQSLRMKIAARTEPVRDLVFALAFSQTGLIGDGEAS